MGRVLGIDLVLGISGRHLQFLGLGSGQVKHGIAQDDFAYAAQASCAQFAFHGMLHHQIKGVCLEGQGNVIHGEKFDVLAYQGIFGFGEDATQCAPLQRPQGGQYRKTSNKLGDEAKVFQIRRVHIRQGLAFFDPCFTSRAASRSRGFSLISASQYVITALQTLLCYNLLQKRKGGGRSFDAICCQSHVKDGRRRSRLKRTKGATASVQRALADT